jgi:MFS family permease
MTRMTTSPPAASPQPAASAPRRGPARFLPADPALRRLSAMTSVNALGNGLFFAISALYFTQFVGLGVARVGFGLTLAGACGVAAAVPAGRAADRWGSRPTLIVLNAVEAVGMASYTLIRGYAAFLVLACLVTVVDRSVATVRNVLYADVLPKESRVASRALLRTLSNVAMGLGSALAALTLQFDTRAAFAAAILFNAATFLASAVLLTRIPVRPRPSAAAGTGGAEGTAAQEGAVQEGAAQEEAAPQEAVGPRRRTALRDLPYLVVTLLNAVLYVQFAVLEVGMPLWIVRDTNAPKPLAAATMITNTVLVALFQVRVSRTAKTPARAARACVRAGLTLAAFCVVAGLAHGLPAVAASCVLVLSVVLQSVGEMLSQAGGWALSYDLADEDAMGSYQGVFYAGTATATMVGPSLVAVSALAHGMPGWLLLAALFAFAGLAMPVAVRAARRAHPGQDGAAAAA